VLVRTLKRTSQKSVECALYQSKSKTKRLLVIVEGICVTVIIVIVVVEKGYKCN
jgi:t-SNARE complex subunit (syntaxin)